MISLQDFSQPFQLFSSNLHSRWDEPEVVQPLLPEETISPEKIVRFVSHILQPERLGEKVKIALHTLSALFSPSTIFLDRLANSREWEADRDSSSRRSHLLIEQFSSKSKKTTNNKKWNLLLLFPLVFISSQFFHSLLQFSSTLPRFFHFSFQFLIVSLEILNLNELATVLHTHYGRRRLCLHTPARRGLRYSREHRSIIRDGGRESEEGRSRINHIDHLW